MELFVVDEIIMEIKIFYAWMSDNSIPNNVNRSFIQTALERAAKTICNDDSIQVVPVIDRDTWDVAGTPSIPQTILQKIDECHIFVCDVTIINAKSRFRPTPNPNVLFELGYALNKLGWNKIIMVMNEAFGKIDKLPFDLEKRRTTLYNVPVNIEEKAQERNKLEKQLEGAIRLIMEKSDFQTNVKDKPKSLFLTQAQKLGLQKEYETFRDKWLYSDQGILDVVESINKVFSRIRQNYLLIADTLSALNIESREEKGFFSIFTKKFGCQINLQGFHESDFYTNRISDINLELTLFGKTRYPSSEEVYTTKAIKQFSFRPDIDQEKSVVWINQQKESDKLTEEKISERLFELLFTEIDKPKKISGSVEFEDWV